MDQQQMDAYAKSQGFPDYKTMQAWYNHRSESLKRPRDYIIEDDQDQQPMTAGNWLQLLFNNPAQALARFLPQTNNLMRVNDEFDKIEKRK